MTNFFEHTDVGDSRNCTVIGLDYYFKFLFTTDGDGRGLPCSLSKDVSIANPYIFKDHFFPCRIFYSTTDTRRVSFPALLGSTFQGLLCTPARSCS